MIGHQGSILALYQKGMALELVLMTMFMYWLSPAHHYLDCWWGLSFAYGIIISIDLVLDFPIKRVHKFSTAHLFIHYIYRHSVFITFVWSFWTNLQRYFSERLRIKTNQIDLWFNCINNEIIKLVMNRTPRGWLDLTYGNCFCGVREYKKLERRIVVTWP